MLYPPDKHNVDRESLSKDGGAEKLEFRLRFLIKKVKDKKRMNEHLVS